MPFVTFDFGETTRAVPGDGSLAIVERLLQLSTETNSTEPYQLALKIQARIEGQATDDIPMTRKEDRDELWEIVNPLRAERLGDQWLDLLWQALSSARVQDHGAIELIRAELERLGADADTVGPTDAIRVKDYGEGYAQLEGSPVKPDFAWYGPADEILERLSQLPDRAGPEAIRSEFHQ